MRTETELREQLRRSESNLKLWEKEFESQDSAGHLGYALYCADMLEYFKIRIYILKWVLGEVEKFE